MTDIMTPTLGESVTEATVARWAKKAGEAVRKDEVLVELETDKVSLEVVAPEDGVLSEIDAAEGVTVTPGAVLGRVTAGGVAAPRRAGGEGRRSRPRPRAPAPAASPAPPPAPVAPRPGRRNPPSRCWPLRPSASSLKTGWTPARSTAPARTAGSPRATRSPRWRPAPTCRVEPPVAPGPARAPSPTAKSACA